MSITVSNCFQICNSPLNLSNSKQLFSFSKANRFQYMRGSLNEKICYDLPNVKEKRSAALGYGTKSDFTKLALKTPPPNQYQLQSFIETNKAKNKGKSIGVSRELMEMSGTLGQLNKFSPGPGAYKLSNTLSNIKYSFRIRTTNDDPMVQDIRRKVPGPGQYQTPVSLNQNGKYFNSKFHNSGSKVFNPPRSKRFPESKTIEPPGPGQYSYVQMPKDGKYMVSNFKSSNCRTFSHQLRNTLSTGFLTPGPGAYRLQSDFGHYESKNSSQKALTTNPQ